MPMTEEAARVVAFYLPQYHRIPQNDQWWGEGFTDWTNVRRARPLFGGHEQPKVPTVLGYYDLGDLDVHHAQAALAKQYGVGAFCYYAYWFGGRRLLERPLDLVGANPDLAMPYAICWANEPWTRRWDGSESQILMEQPHSPEGDAGFIEAIASHLADRRYLRVDGRPILLVYRASLLVEPLRTTDGLRERANQLGIGDLHLAMVQSFDHSGHIERGFDSAVEFPPHGLTPNVVERALQTSSLSTPSYAKAMRVSLSRAAPQFRWFRTAMPGWDNTARRGARGTVFVGATPDLFREWLEDLLRWTYLFRPPGERLVFVNAWNEWAEGAYLEPDALRGHKSLEAVRAALEATAGLAGETAILLRTGEGPGGQLATARRQWEQDAEMRLRRIEARPFPRRWALRIALWSDTTLRRIPPVYWLARNTAGLLRRLRRRWAEP
jgi:lipopolysaccharide biosynthesis protein